MGEELEIPVGVRAGDVFRDRAGRTWQRLDLVEDLGGGCADCPKRRVQLLGPTTRIRPTIGDVVGFLFALFFLVFLIVAIARARAAAAAAA